MLHNTQYAVSVWLTSQANEAFLQRYIESDKNTGGIGNTCLFAQDAKMDNLNTDFVEAVFYTNPALIFDAIDKVSYGKYFRSECVKILYPQQFASYNSLIFVYGRNGESGTINQEIFASSQSILNNDLKYVGLIPFIME